MSKERVRGRVRTEVGGDRYTVELTNGGLLVRRYKCWRVYTVPLAKVVALAQPQLQLFPKEVA